MGRLIVCDYLVTGLNLASLLEVKKLLDNGHTVVMFDDSDDNIPNYVLVDGGLDIPEDFVMEIPYMSVYYKTLNVLDTDKCRYKVLDVIAYQKHLMDEMLGAVSVVPREGTSYNGTDKVVMDDGTEIEFKEVLHSVESTVSQRLGLKRPDTSSMFVYTDCDGILNEQIDEVLVMNTVKSTGVMLIDTDGGYVAYVISDLKNTEDVREDLVTWFGELSEGDEYETVVAMLSKSYQQKYAIGTWQRNFLSDFILDYTDYFVKNKKTHLYETRYLTYGKVNFCSRRFMFPMLSVVKPLARVAFGGMEIKVE